MTFTSRSHFLITFLFTRIRASTEIFDIFISFIGQRWVTLGLDKLFFS